MFAAFALLASLARLALALDPADLKVSLTTEGSFTSVNEILITAIVSNPTDKAIRVLKAHNVLDSSATQSFDIQSSDGKVVPFAGAKVTYDLTNESLYVNIPAGQTVAVNHTIGSFYDFSSFAAGEVFTITSRSIFQAGFDDPAIFAPADAVKIQITDDLSFQHFHKRAPATSSPQCTDPNELNTMNDALRYARSLAGGAATDIRDTNREGPRFQRYFGGNNVDDIWFNLDRIAGDLVGNRGIFCQRDHDDAASFCNGNPGVIAYTVVTSGSVDNPVFVCDLFFQSGSTSSICDTQTYDSTMSSSGGIILHELSHAVDNTDDVIYGCTACEQLSATDKKRNADNYRCVGLNVYLDWNCINGPRLL